MSEVILSVGNTQYGGWESIRIRRGIQQICGEFELSTTERWPGQWDGRRIQRGETCTVAIDGDTVITGYVDDSCPSYDDESHSVCVTGRDKTEDLVDCSAVYKSGHWRGVTLLQIATDMAKPFGISVSADVDVGGPFRDFAIQEGETVFEALARAASMRGVLLVADGVGNLLITRAGTSRASAALERGKNIRSAQGQFSFRDRYSQYTVKGQRRGTDDDVGTPELLSGASASVTDQGVTRYRPLVVLAEDQGDGATFAQRAAWERNTRLGSSIRVSITVSGWREQNTTGPLWLPNRIVHVTDDWLGLSDDLLVASVSYVLDGRGTVSDLELTHPGAFAVLQVPEKSGATS